MSLQTLCRKMSRALRHKGLRGTAAIGLQALRQTARELSPSVRRARRTHRLAERDFDARYGVETAGVISLGELNIDSANWEHGSRYQATGPGEFHAMLQSAGEPARGRAFVDFGCGKGRVLFLASEYPFERIVGIEFSPELVDVARKNLTTYRNPKQICRKIGIITGDAAAYELPEEPLVLFFYNPFDAVVMRKVVDNIRRSLERLPRPVTVVYHTPEHESLLAPVPSLQKQDFHACRRYSIFHSI